MYAFIDLGPSAYVHDVSGRQSHANEVQTTECPTASGLIRFIPVNLFLGD